MKLRTLWFTLALTVASAAYGTGNNNPLSTSLEQKVQGFRAELEARGYEVVRGHWNLFRIEDCKFAIASMGNCLGNNPAAPYVFPSFPLWPDEFVDNNMKEAFGPLPEDSWATYRLDEREAVIVLGLLPPPGRYFGIQTYVYSRADNLDPTDPVFLQTLLDPIMHKLFFAASPNPSRVLTFSSIGNSNNNVVVEQQSGTAFNRQRYFIITPDAVMQRDMTEALVRSGVAERNEIFTEPVSPEVARVGLGADADDFITLVRYAHPENEEAGELWREQLPLVVLRVRDKNTTRPTEPWPAPAYDEKTAFSELGLQGNHAELVEAVRQHWGQPEAPVGSFQSLQRSVDLIGQHCLPRPMNCLGDTQDTDYQVSPSVTIDSGEVIAVAGTLGTATGNATYVGLSVNRVAVLTGVANLSDTDLEGSASAFSGSADNTDKFYVQYFARDCTALPNCQALSEELVPRGEAIKIIQRNYIVPGTARGGDPALLLNPAVIVFDGSARPSGQ